MSKVEVIRAAHEALGDGSFKGCRSSYSAGKSGCNQCCTFGSILLPGEEEYLLEQKSAAEWDKLGVTITQGKISNCMGKGKKPGEKTCKMGDAKTLYCKIYPEAVWTDGPTAEAADVMHLSVHDDVCPATNLSADRPWLGRVKRAKRIIREGIGTVSDDFVVAACPAQKLALTIQRLVDSLEE